MARQEDILQALLALANSGQLADRLEDMGHKFIAAAAALRENSESESIKSPQGIQDRVQMAVVGPNGDVKQRTDTAKGA